MYYLVFLCKADIFPSCYLYYLLLSIDIKRSIVYSLFLIFADDLKLFLKINSFRGCLLLQDDLNSLVKWTKECGLELNILKCRSILFYRTCERINYSYMINDCCL